MVQTTSFHTFPQPVTVVCYIPQKICWNKAEYRALPSRLPKWEKSVLLENGCVREAQLLLDENLLPNIKVDASNVLLLRGTETAEWIRLAPSYRVPFFLNLYRKEGDIWVELQDYYYPNFGSKSRGYFDLFPLMPGKSAAIHINVRYWHTMAGRSMNTYYEEHFLYLEHLGQFEQVVLVKNLAEELVFRPEKEVDLRRMMY